jgi:hypothetical protein
VHEIILRGFEMYDEYNDWLDDEPAIDLNKLEKLMFQGLSRSIEKTVNSGLDRMVASLNEMINKELAEIPDSITNTLNK